MERLAVGIMDRWSLPGVGPTGRKLTLLGEGGANSGLQHTAAGTNSHKILRWSMNGAIETLYDKWGE